MKFSDKAIKFFKNINSNKSFSDGVEIINPYKSAEVKSVIIRFYTKFFNDNKDRVFVLGINPGRFGGGLTGIAFTDPVALKVSCGIENQLGNRRELSSKFIYEMISAYGGAELFYSDIFLSALYPLALVKNGRNFNFYDDKRTFELLKQEMINSIKKQIQFGAKRNKVIILGKKNAEYFKHINDQLKLFETISVLDHPRYIMQYRLKKINKYIDDYLLHLSG